jgi:hypothetical protein
MATRIKAMRSLLRTHIQELGNPHDWQHITDQVGVCWLSCSVVCIDAVSGELPGPVCVPMLHLHTHCTLPSSACCTNTDWHVLLHWLGA